MDLLETEGLLIRHFALADLDAIHREVYGDPEVARYYCGQVRSLDQTLEWLHYRSYESRHSEFGLQAVALKEGGEVIGLCGLQPYVGRWLVAPELSVSPYLPLEVELTYAFGQRFWGKGLAFEACQAMIAYAFGILRLRRLVTGCHPQNVRARSLQLRLGMRQVWNPYPHNPSWEGILDNNNLSGDAQSDNHPSA